MSIDDRATLDELVRAEDLLKETLGLSTTILWHPNPCRIGHRALEPLTDAVHTLELSRWKPWFDDGRPLDEAHVSRTPLRLEICRGKQVRVRPGRPGLRFTVDGQPCPTECSWPYQALQRGLVIGLGALVLVRVGPMFQPRERHGLIGVSAEIERVRNDIDRLAGEDQTVLILGPSGVGKELVAWALHQASRRAKGPFVPLNMAALPATTAPSQLFGHAKGAFTGADRCEQGYFGRANGGTLFLDEIGACPVPIQALLLRAIEQGQVQPVGGKITSVDVRILAATDEDLEAATTEGRFRLPLYHRLARRVLRIPPLRERLADVAVQAVGFFREALSNAGALDRLESEGPAGPWLGMHVFEALLSYDWPGNTRELRSVVEQLVVEFAERPVCGAPRLATGPGFFAPTADEPEPLPKAGSSASEPDIEAALRAHGYRLNPTAKALGIGINTLRRRMEALGLRRAKDLSRDEVREALERYGNVAAVARALRVSEHGLKVHITKLGLTTPS